MANRSEKNPGNVPGQFYVDTTCIDCDMCREIAPQSFRRDDDLGMSIVQGLMENDADRKSVV